MKASKYYDSDFLTAEDIGSRAVELTISAITEGTFKNDDNTESTRLIVHFDNSAKPLRLNRGNCRKLIEAFGDETDNWIGNIVVLAVGKQSYNGKTFAVVQVAGTRIHASKKK